MAAPLRALLVGKPRPAGSLRCEPGNPSEEPGAMTSLTLVRRIKARPQIVFDAVTTAEGIAQWWGCDAGPVLAAEADPRVGGLFRARFRMLDNTEHECSGEFLEIARTERVVMSWRWKGGLEDPGESRLEITLKAIPEGTETPLVHSQMQ